MKTSGRRTSRTADTLEIRVFEAVCLNERPPAPAWRFSDLAAMIVPKVLEEAIRAMLPVKAVVYAPRAPSMRWPFLDIQMPMEPVKLRGLFDLWTPSHGLPFCT